MLSPVLLLATVAVGLVPAAAELATARWPRRSPAAAIMLWQAMGLGWGVAAMGTLAALGADPAGPGVAGGALTMLDTALRRVDASARVPAEPLGLLRAIPIFTPLPAPVLERLATGAVAVHVPAGETVFAQGDRGDRFYAIESGRAGVSIDGAETRELGPGEFFGEIALLRDVPRTATVRALGGLQLYAVERDDFIAAVTGHAPSLDAAQSVVAMRLPTAAAV